MTLRQVIQASAGIFENFHTSSFGWFLDVADILILAYLFYQLALLIRGTRAVQMMAGVIFIIAFYSLAGVLQLVTVQRFLGYLLYWIPFAMIIIFQNTIRRLLTRFGHNPFSAKVQSGQASVVVSEVVLSASALASRGIGGLIVIEREQGLRNYTETGITVDAALTHDLIASIFQHGSPLHDGAVVIQDGRVRAAACFLPLAARAGLGKEFGTRHRAAVGITEETDALCVVISEERGTIAVAFEGRLYQDLSAEDLRAFLRQHLDVVESVDEAAAEAAEARAETEAPREAAGP